MAFFDRMGQRELVRKFNSAHDVRGRFSSADEGYGPDRRAEMANTQERHLKASAYHTERAAVNTFRPPVAQAHTNAAQAHLRAAVSGTYDDRRFARDSSVIAHGVEDAHSSKVTA